MDGIPWILIALLAGLILAVLGVLLFKRYKREGVEPDYRTFYTVGLIWTIIGIPLYLSSDNIAFLAMGVVFLIAGLVNKDKWREPESVTPQKKKLLISLVVLAVVFIAITVLFGFLNR